MKKTLSVLLLGFAAAAAHAGGLEALENFVKTARSGKAEFTQVVTAPPRDGQAARSRTSGGTFEFNRPNRFRFDYLKPFKQSIVADGQTLWMYDADLNQVTARKQEAVLGSTPAAVIAAAPDLGALRRDFNLEAAPDKDGLQWVQATPKAKEGQLNQVRIGFRGNDLATLEILDGFGQRSVMTFDKLQLNTAIPGETFQFKPPQGADVVRQ
ncbi:outer membrane lipoprotein chaperone LolA [Ramlibacter humi]|uniref:Outer-membrane lipoprotein carrier protein n=1 Tax=Ramlibacter humi TaxID=2530451 RepID=A0A4Z0BLT7_9BURK|nr:outer membrane lipoprotein chaperone LolA [Ramlibacter humi]TFY98888.1 outer membrane lipoprotein chaperone LolA [Ramlibacter humi]